MPVTAKLSRQFYERLGDDIANELVDWFNAVDATYRADLERLNELNFQRFDARVEQRFAQADVKLEQGLAALEVRFGQQLADHQANVNQRFAAIEVTIERQGSTLRNEIARSRNGLMRWMFAFWATTVLTILALYVGG